MSLIVPWNGSDIDIDPLDFSMAEWEQIEQRAGIASFGEMLQALGGWSPAAWKAVYWTGVKRAGLDPGDFGDFAGPTFAQIFSRKDEIVAFTERAGELLGVTRPKAPLPASDGLEPSELSTAGVDPPSSTT